MNTAIKRISALNYFGGKSRHLDWLLPLLDVPHTHYVEPFCGAASVFLNKKPSLIETISDASGRLINFFRVLRERPEELIMLLELTPYSRGEWDVCREQSEDPLEDARRFFALSMMSYGGRICTGREVWRMSFTNSRHGVSMDAARMYRRIDGLLNVVARLRMAQIENRPAQMKEYLHEMTLEEHEALLYQVKMCESHIAISGYDSELYNDHLRAVCGWQKHSGPLRQSNLGNKATREILWTNYIIDRQQNLFSS
jgi:DNA adenine methylase